MWHLGKMFSWLSLLTRRSAAEDGDMGVDFAGKGKELPPWIVVVGYAR